MLQFNDDVFIRFRLLLIVVLKEHMLKQSNPELYSKIIYIFKWVFDTFPDATRNSSMIEEEVNKFFNKIDSGQCSNVLLIRFLSF